MKKIFLSLFFSVFSLIASAYDFEKDGIYYKIIDDVLRTVEVTPSPNFDYSGSMVIPKIVKPKSSAYYYIVTNIGGNAFKQCVNLTSIELPSSIENIYYNAFEDCLNLKSFTFPESVKFIGNSVFKNCRNLSTVIYNATNANSSGRIQYGSPLATVFENCISLNSIYIGSNVENIPKTLFAGTPIVSIKFPKSIKVIGEGAFMNCYSLSSISFDNECKLSKVDNYAFSYCKTLNNFKLPNTVSSIGEYAFQYCENLTEFPFSHESDITFFGSYAFTCCRAITELYFPSKVTTISSYAFEDCRNLKYIYFPETILSIGSGAFDAIWTLPDIYCTSLTPPIIEKSTSSAFEEIFSNLDKTKCILHVPQESLNDYLLTEPWCKFPNIVTGITPASISLDKSIISLNVGDEYQFNPILFPWFTQDYPITYSSSNKSVAEIDNDGIIHALKEGSSTITIQAGSCKTTASVSIKKVYPTSVTLSEAEKTVLIGDEFDLIATVHPDNVTDKTITWETTDENICVVDQNGHVTAVGLGECWILANCPAKSGLCKVTVKPVEVFAISINKNDPTIGGFIGNKITLDVIVLPVDATDKSLTWSVEDPEILSVDENGVVTLLSLGGTYVRATANNGVFAERYISVYPRLPQTFSISPENISLNVGESFTFTVNMTPDNIDDRTIRWYSSEPEKVSIDENGTVTALTPDCFVRIYGIASGLESSAYVEVKPIQVEEIVLSSNNISVQLLGDGSITYSDILTASVFPEYASNKKITWTSTDESVAYYSEFFDWHIAVGGPGTAVITATSSNGVSASCTVTVTQDVTNVIFPKFFYNVYIGETIQIAYEVNPSNATDKTLLWSSSNNSIATVNENGEVIGHKEGQVTIKAIAKNGIYNECQVSVKPVLSESILLDCSSKEIKIGESFILNATVYPINTTDTSIQWATSDKQVASVSKDGEVVGIAPGNCIISAFNGMNRADCDVIVLEDASINDINADNMSPVVISQNGSIIIDGIDEKTEACIFDTAGNMIYKGIKRVIPINIKGVYLVVIKQKHYKVVVL